MEALGPSLSTSLVPTSKNTFFRNKATKSNLNLISPKKFTHLIGNRRLTARISAINDVSATMNPAGVEVTWQIVVGAIAGVTPFVVAGIEFSKRIIAQRRCELCGGSGLVLNEKDYIKCPGCGGFLPWQSWKRFFSG
ncbi:transmembrane protein [Fagus crenata]